MTRLLALIVLLGLSSRTAWADLESDDWRVLMVNFEKCRRDGRKEDAIEQLAEAPEQDLRLTRKLVELLGDWREALLRKRLLAVLRRTTQADCVAYIGKRLDDRRTPIPVRRDLFLLCGQLKSPEIHKVLLARLGHADVWVRVAAVDGLGYRPEKSVEKAIIARLADAAWQVRYAAIEALVRRGGPGAVKPLIARLGKERGRLAADVRRALQALTGMNHPDAAAWSKWLAKVGAWLNRQPGDRLARYRQLSPAPARGQASLFGIPIDGEDVVFVIEKSKKLDRKVRERMIGGLTRALEALPEKTRFNLVFCRRRPMVWKPAGPVPATKKNVAEAVKLVGRNDDHKQTDLFAGLQRAISHKNYYRDPLHKKNFSLPLVTVFLITQGRPDTGKHPFRKVAFAGKAPWHEELALIVDGWLGLRKVRVNVVGIGQPFAPLLEELTRVNAGRLVTPGG